MTVTDKRIDRLSRETGRRLIEHARTGRRRAVASISRCCVTVTLDGQTTREVLFEHTPTIAQIFDRVGPGVFIVSIGMKHRPLRERIRLALAAE